MVRDPDNPLVKVLIPEKVLDAVNVGINASSIFTSTVLPAPPSTIWLPKDEVRALSFGNEAVFPRTTYVAPTSAKIPLRLSMSALTTT